MLREILLLALLLHCPFAGAAEGKPLFTGIVRTGMMAIGGETTGTILETKDGNIELEFGKDVDPATISALAGKNVTVQGTLTTKHGVERSDRKVLHVES